MTKAMKDQFQIIRLSIRTIDNSRARSDLRKNQMLVKTWNNTFKWLMDQSVDKYERALIRSYYGMINDQTAQELTWEQMKKFVENILKGDRL